MFLLYKADEAYPLYTGVHTSVSRVEWASFLATNLLAYYLGDSINITEKQCDHLSKQQDEKFGELMQSENKASNKISIIVWCSILG